MSNDISAAVERAYDIVRIGKSKAPLPDAVIAALVLADFLIPHIEAVMERILNRPEWVGPEGGGGIQ